MNWLLGYLKVIDLGFQPWSVCLPNLGSFFHTTQETGAKRGWGWSQVFPARKGLERGQKRVLWCSQFHPPALGFADRNISQLLTHEHERWRWEQHLWWTFLRQVRFPRSPSWRWCWRGILLRVRVSPAWPESCVRPHWPLRGHLRHSESSIRRGEPHSNVLTVAPRMGYRIWKWYSSFNRYHFSWLLICSCLLTEEKRSYFLYNVFFHPGRKPSQAREKHEVTMC